MTPPPGLVVTQLRAPQRKPTLFNILVGRLLADLPYKVVAVVIEKDRLKDLHPDGKIDGYLPLRLYPMAVHMLFERVVHCLYSMGDRIGILEAEGVGQTEDAYLQHAVLTLKLRGTRYLSEGWFRYQLRDHVEFFGKSDNRALLQLADWVVKPCADAVLSAREGSDKPPHPIWDAVRGHLYDGMQARPDKFGIKVYPSAPEAQRRRLFPTEPVMDDVGWGPVKLKGP